ncbi:hypothetical protein [Lysobacter enzymogenes]|uniref:Lipoprotein n=1 Tax=Lysobacter enzymogenes TaxID=69 RepID=A0AAU9AP59_LYSEN|nr:hypothetical protein [Lysobacter enzymogenes]BAV97340.1 hypothetical protein LEN_1853 [Lysobacter enzymogenes]
MKTTLGVALTPPTAAALIAGACLLAAAFLPSCHARDMLRTAAVAPAKPCRAGKPGAAADARGARRDAHRAAAPAAAAIDAAQAAPGAAPAAEAGHAASGQR